MAKSKKKFQFPAPQRVQATAGRRVASLLDAMQDGNEYGSIVGVLPPDNANLLDEVLRAMQAVEALRHRPCIAYVGNVVRADSGESGIDATDDVPFAELVASVPAASREVDVLLATRGGSAHQVSRFVNALRGRFDTVEFLIPSFCMSAGTLFALSGDRIWMTPRACLGPIDPQVPSKDGRYVPAQALLVLVGQLQQQGDQALANGQAVPWTAVRLIDSLDKKELGDAITATYYSTEMAARFLVNYKFRNWANHATTGAPVTPAEKEDAAQLIANALAAHDRWKNHGHAIPRDVLWQEVKLKIDAPDAPLERALTRLWALCNWVFDKSQVLKFMRSTNYGFVRSATGGTK